MSFFYGIDFGTTNSAVISYDERTQKLRTIGDLEDNNPIPSVLAIKNFDDEVTVGRTVKNNMLRLLEEGRHVVVKSVKSSLDEDIVWETDTRSWNAEEVATELFKALATRVLTANLPPMQKAVVAIPIGMTSEKRTVLRKAARRAGIEILTFISEPTAAFIAHAEQLKTFRNVVVFDWGGGTLDVSVLQQRGGNIIEQYTAGLRKAGDDIDEILARWVHEQIAEKYNLNISYDSVPPSDRQILLNSCESAKIALQEDELNEKTISLGSYAGQNLIKQVIPKATFEGLIINLVQEAISLLKKCIAESHISDVEIGKLLIVGGTSKLALFQKELRRNWDFPNLMFPDGAEWDIARGAAHLAHKPGSYRTAENIGLELCDGEFYSVIPFKTPITESSRKINLGLVEDTQTATFIFSTQKEELLEHRRIGELHAPCFGFSEETIELNCRITEDLTFEAKASSSHIQKNGSAPIFKFDKLRWQYDFDQ